MSDTSRTLYLTDIRCPECGNTTTYAHTAGMQTVDMEAPWPRDIYACPECTMPYPDDLGVVIEDVHDLGSCIDATRREIAAEDKLGASRDQIVDGTCARLQRRLHQTVVGADR